MVRKMAKGNYSPTSCIKEHLDVTYRKTKESTRNKYAGILYMVNDILRTHGMETHPRKIDDDDITFLLEYWGGYAISTRKWYFHIINRYLRYFGNDIIEKMDPQFGYDDRPNVDWLTDEQCTRLMSFPMSPLESTVIHLELCMGLRVSEVCKLRMDDVHISEDIRKSFISVCGKGRGEGKWRTIPFHPQSKEVFEKWLAVRSQMVYSIRSYNKTWVDPGTLLIWCHYKDKPDGGRYKERSKTLDRAVIHKVSTRIGFDFKNHTLRRTFGRNLYHSGVPLETIMKLYGHDQQQTTIDYIGVNLEDMTDALSKMYLHQLSQIPRRRDE